jgi:hypothetical protein
LAQVALACGLVSLAFVILIFVGFFNILTADMASLMMLLSIVCAPTFGLLAIIIALVDLAVYRHKRPSVKPQIKTPLILGSSGIAAVCILMLCFLLLSHTLSSPW